MCDILIKHLLDRRYENLIQFSHRLHSQLKFNKFSFFVLRKIDIEIKRVFLRRNRVIPIDILLHFLVKRQQLQRIHQTLLVTYRLTLSQLLPHLQRSIIYQMHQLQHPSYLLRSQHLQQSIYLHLHLLKCNARQHLLYQVSLTDIMIRYMNDIASGNSSRWSLMQIRCLHHYLEIVLNLQTSPIRQRQQLRIIQQCIEVLYGLRFQLTI